MKVQKQRWHDFTNYLILEADGQGSVQLEIYDTPRSQFKVQAYICRLFVEPEARRRGIAYRLMMAAEATAKTLGHDVIFLEWREGEASKEILDWYRCLGYEDWGGNEEQILLKKSLS